METETNKDIHQALRIPAIALRRDRFRNTPRIHLNQLAAQGQLDQIQLLLENENEVDVNWRSPSGVTALFLASKAGHIEVVRILLEHGANDLEASLAVALEFGHKNIARCLRKAVRGQRQKTDEDPAADEPG